MYQKILASLVVFLFALTATGCGQLSEKDRIKNAMVEIACSLAKPLMDKTKNMNSADETAIAALQAEAKGIEVKMEDILKKHGIAGKDEMDKLSGKYKDDKAFEKDVKDTMKSSCGFDADAPSPF